MKLPIILQTILLSLLFSCHEETLCDTAGYAGPEMALADPEGPDIEVHSDSLFSLKFLLSAEAGLNTLSVIEPHSDYKNPIHAFTNGETEIQFVYERYYWESGQLEFILYDLCDQSTTLTVNLTLKFPSY
ncbi:MAG: hypothetical protein GY790_12250 [Bacteroidetes bacterium]|nr:hypothetical protein [Bacteroidota bacterium]